MSGCLFVLAPHTRFEDILKLYHFDQELSVLIFSMISKIEVSLRVRLVEALLIHGDSLVLQDSSLFRNKKTLLAKYVNYCIRDCSI